MQCEIYALNTNNTYVLMSFQMEFSLLPINGYLELNFCLMIFWLQGQVQLLLIILHQICIFLFPQRPSIIYYFLGVEVTYNVSGMHFSQQKFIKELSKMTSLGDVEHVSTQMTLVNFLSKVDDHILSDLFVHR